MGEWCWSGLNHTLLNQSVVVNALELEALKRGVHTAGKQTPKIHDSGNSGLSFRTIIVPR